MAAARTAAAVTLLGGSIAVAAGCTFLITFDDVPTHDAGTTTTTATTPPDETPPPVDTSPIPTPFDSGSTLPTGESCDNTLNRSGIRGCNNFNAPDAEVCARDPSLSPYPFPGTIDRDLVTCNGGVATCVVHCTTRCAALPSGFPDQCDHCNGRTAGTYCGSELGWVAKDANVLVHCSSGSIATSPALDPCTNTCIPGSPAGSARCSP
jgi:hypothetical protein